MNREEAINVVKCNWPEGRHQLSEALKTLIPEFQESEDERIRKRLVEYFNGFYDRFSSRNNVNVHWEGLEVKAVIAYLEKQKEQKPAEWSEEDQRMLERVINSQKHVIPVPGKKGWEDMTTREERDTEAIRWLRELPSRIRPVQEWSEEDKENKETAIRFLNTFAYRANLFDENGEIKSHDLRSCVDWLKSLRPQPKQEWSQEDARNIDGVVELISDYALETGQIDEESGEPKEPYDSYIRFVRSLRPQPHWRPSEEQMQALELVLEYHVFANPQNKEHINSLHNDLQKLL